MLKKIAVILFYALALCLAESNAQDTGAGIGIYPTGSEVGAGYRSSKNARLAADIRLTKANVYTGPLLGSFVSEASMIYRIVYFEKVRFHIGLGGKGDWNFGPNTTHRMGLVTPIGVEAFPFPFQNAGLFFEVAPYVTWAINNNNPANIGLRTSAGFVFYFPVKAKEENKK